jgi:GNAT superfamily N-acetyltransferase
MKVRLRRARAEDARSIAALSAQLGYPASPSALRQRLRTISRRQEHAAFVAESSSREIVGWIHVFIHRVLESEPRAEIGGLVVDERARGARVGTILLQRAERWARTNKLKSVYLRSNIIRREAHAFYLARGYRIIKTQHAFLKDL